MDQLNQCFPKYNYPFSSGYFYMIVVHMHNALYMLPWYAHSLNTRMYGTYGTVSLYHHIHYHTRCHLFLPPLNPT